MSMFELLVGISLDWEKGMARDLGCSDGAWSNYTVVYIVLCDE